MKIQTIVRTRLFLSALTFVCCFAAAGAAAQSVPVTFRESDVSLEQLLQAIEKQTNYLFAYDKSVDVQRKVSVDASSTPLSTVLDSALDGSGVSYSVEGSSIVLSSRATRQDGEVTVTGRVVDPAGAPVIGATVVVRGGAGATISGVDGSFSLQAPAGATLGVSLVGYTAAEVPLAGRTQVVVTLQEEAIGVDAVVITALGIKRAEKALSYNVQSVAADEIVGNKDVNFVNSLSGKVAGVTINASSSGIGGASSVVMRGVKSISKSSNALYVIDGVPMFSPRKSEGAGGSGTEFDSQGTSEPIADLNPEDIASISVLNGAAAAALYGSDAANGVILVTTKKGQAGTVSVTVASSTELSAPFVLPRFQTRYGTGDLAVSTPVMNESWGAKLNQFNHMGYDPRSDYFQTGVTATESVSLTTGTERSQTYLSAAAVNAKGVVPNNGYNRYNFTFRNSTNFLNDRMTLDVGASYIKQDDRNMTNQGQYANPLWGAYLFPRGNDWNDVRMYERYDPVRKIYTQYWPAGDYGGTVQNPYWVNYRNLRENNKERYMLNAALTYNILDWLSASGRVNVDNSVTDYTEKFYATTHQTLTSGSDRGLYGVQRTKDKSTYADAMVNINKSFGDDWSLQANVGGSISDVQSDLMRVKGPIISDGLVTGEGVTLTNFWSIQNLSPSRTERTQEGWREQVQSVFASAEVGFRGAYYLTLTGRTDWASQLFGPKSTARSFTYPSVGASVVLSEIFDLPRQISYLKLRGSFASVGVAFPREWANPRHPWQNGIWQNRTNQPMYELKPERTDSWEVGVTARFLRHFDLDLSLYDTKTRNQTFDITLPASSMYSSMYVQTGAVRNRGIELSLGYNNKWGKLGWETGYTFSANANRILSIAADIYDPATGGYTRIDQLSKKPLGYVNFILKDGGTMGDLYSVSDFRRDSEGNIYVDEKGGVSTVNITDPNDFVYLGSVLPKGNMAWRNGFTYGNFNLGFMLSARLGGIVYSRTQGTLDYYGVSEATAAARDLGYATINGGDRINPETWFKTIGASHDIPQYYTYSATNVRLSEASVGYTIPRKVLGDVCDVQVSLVGRNLWMIYNKAPYDPETVARTSNFYQGVDYFMMPSLRNIGFNLRVKF